MKKQIPLSVVGLVIVIVIAVCGFIYTRLPIAPEVNPTMPKGSNKPPAGFRKQKVAGAKTANEARKAKPGAGAPAKDIAVDKQGNESHTKKGD